MSDSHGKFCWYELLTTDPTAAGAFYTRVIGWTAEDSGLPGMAYTLFKIAGQGVGGVMTLPEEARQAGARPGWMGYIWVRDLDAAVEKLKASGGRIYKPAEDIPSVGVLRSSPTRKVRPSSFFGISAIRKGQRMRPARQVRSAGTSCRPLTGKAPLPFTPTSLDGPRRTLWKWVSRWGSIRSSPSMVRRRVV